MSKPWYQPLNNSLLLLERDVISHTDPVQDDTVQVRVNGPSGTLIMNRPEKKNALTQSMVAQLQLGLSDLHQEKKVRAVILTGAGAAFSSGTDLQEVHESMSDEQAQQRWFEDCQAQQQLLETLLRFPKPVIAAVNGPALGFAAALVMASDIIIGTEAATFGFPETRRGLVPGFAAPLLAFRLGAGIAADRLLRGDLLNGSEAVSIGVYHSLVTERLVWAKASELAQQQEKTSATAAAMSKRLLNETVGEQVFKQLSAGAAATAAARTTEAASEGVNAFLEKREPEWK